MLYVCSSGKQLQKIWIVVYLFLFWSPALGYLTCTFSLQQVTKKQNPCNLSALLGKLVMGQMGINLLAEPLL